MIDIEGMALSYREEGYGGLLAEARVCQDIVLKALVKFGTFSGRVKDIYDLCYLSDCVEQDNAVQLLGFTSV